MFLARVLKLYPEHTEEAGSDKDHTDPDHSTQEKKASLMWLIKRLCRETRLEAALAAKSTVKVREIFKFTVLKVHLSI